MGEYQLNGVLNTQGVWKVYDIINLMDNSYLPCMDVLKFCEDLGIMMVPMLSCGYRFSYGVKDMDDKSRNMPAKLKGIVYKTMKPEWLLKHRLAFKVLNAYYIAG